MAYSFNQTAEIDLGDTDLSSAAQDVVDATLTSNPVSGDTHLY